MKTFKQIVSVGLLCVALSACGGQTYREPGSTSGPSTGGDGGNIWNPNPNPSSTPSGTPSYPRITAEFSMNGTGGNVTSFSTQGAGIIVNTENVLKVTVRAGQAGALSIAGTSGGSSFTANYSCVSYLVTVGGRSVRTSPLLANGQPSAACPNGVAEQTIDFSDRTAPGQTYNVVVSEPRYDFYCQMYAQYHNQCLYIMGPYENYWYGDCYSWKSAYQGSYCPTRAVYKNHTVSGSLEIQVNGTN